MSLAIAKSSHAFFVHLIFIIVISLLFRIFKSTQVPFLSLSTLRCIKLIVIVVKLRISNITFALFTFTLFTFVRVLG